LTLCHSLGDVLARRSLRTVLAGFGVGFSWGAAALTLGPLRAAEVIEI
jgi:3-oxoacyl-[acyl-carrier-protein] synthase-3